jgi:hypothetical protein
MSVDKEFLLDALLRHNYLPTQRTSCEELPPIFSASRFTKEVAVELNAQTPRGGGYDQVEYRLTRFNNISRPLSLPHPLAHAKVCLSIYDNWSHIEYITSNPNSIIKPQSHSDGRIIIMDYDTTVSKTTRNLSQSFGMRYKVHTDISNFFPSIYSHAIPWALVGFDEAKEKKPPKYKHEWFNKIDEMLRLSRRGETQGVAIGPATSNVFSEIILARIDERLSKKYEFTRYIDDYTCYCESEDLAQEFIRQLSEELSAYKLLLNIKKTEVVKLPDAISPDWVTELGTRIPSTTVVNSYQALQFLDFAVALSQKHAEGSVLKFAFKSLVKKDLTLSAKCDVFDYGMALSFYNPVLFPLLESLLEDTSLFSEIGASPKFNRLIQEHSRLFRSDGMCWGIYFLSLVKGEIEEVTAQKVMDTGDALSILMLYWSGQHLDKVKVFCVSLDKDDYYKLDNYWLLLYQLFVDDVIDNPYSDSVFDVMKKFGVSFIQSKT